jgi:hypothetical protein
MPRMLKVSEDMDLNLELNQFMEGRLITKIIATKKE